MGANWRRDDPLSVPKKEGISMHTIKSDLILFSAGIVAVVSVIGVDSTGVSFLLAALFG
jgi:hypothetical protein